MRHTMIVASLALVAGTVLAGCRSDTPATQSAANTSTGTGAVSHVSHLNLPSGTTVEVTLATPLTSKSATVGTPWSGSIQTALSVDGHEAIPAGSAVSGTVSAVTAARKGDRAMLDLTLSSVTVDGRSYPIRGGMESVVAGSTRARNLGAIGAATVAGAVVGHAVGGSSKGTLIGGLIGGGAATGVVANSDGYQVALKSGTTLTFTTSEAVAVRE